MRKPAIAGLLLCALFLGTNSSKANAEEFGLVASNTKLNTAGQLVLAEISQKPPTLPSAQSPIKHTVAANETLSGIASQYGSTWQRLFDKNTQLADPDVITPGEEITIPLLDEVLAERPLPEPAEELSAAPVLSTRQAQLQPRVKQARAADSSNGYTRGYCTWYAKSRRPDLPNNLGNANTWVARAAAQGIPTGHAPRVGAIGQQGMHVVYVESVNGDGTVTISEMNFRGWNIVSSRTVTASNFIYIY